MYQEMKKEVGFNVGTWTKVTETVMVNLFLRDELIVFISF